MNFQIPIVSFVGKSNTGKTTLVVKIINELKARGYKVAAIKHSHHELELDTQGKDSWLYRQAGADTVIAASRNLVGIMRWSEQEIPLSEIVNTYLQDVDIIVVEGYKTEAIPKIEVFQTEISDELVCRNDPFLIAMVGDKDPRINKPFFHIDENPTIIIDFLLSKFVENQ